MIGSHVGELLLPGVSEKRDGLPRVSGGDASFVDGKVHTWSGRG